jgi:hypothetical protein
MIVKELKEVLGNLKLVNKKLRKFKGILLIALIKGLN